MNEERKKNYDRASDPVALERRYRNPPVIEALCEIYFSGSEWDETVQGRFYERVSRNDFSKKQQRTIQEAQFTLGPGQAMAGVRQLPPWMQFVSDKKHRMIQLAQELLVVNQLAPYPHFEEWEPDVYQSLKTYMELAKPQKVERLGLRYIDHVEIPRAKVDMKEYFTVYPQMPPALGDTHGSFFVRVETPHEHDHTVLITFGTAVPQQPNPNVQAFMLDFYDIVQINKPFDQINLVEEIQRAHGNVVMAFEGSITDKLRELFEPEDPL